MGGLTSLASTAVQALSLGSNIAGGMDRYRQDDLAYKQAQQQANAAMQNAAERTALEKEQIRLSAEQTETERRAALRRAVARQRALFGVSGVGSGEGSSQAVLLGLFDESEEDRLQRDALDALKKASVDQGVSQSQRINTLQLTQMRERNRLSTLSNKLSAAADLGRIVF